MSNNQEANLNDKLNSLMSSDILSSYTDMEAIKNSKNIVPGSFRYAQDECQDMNIAQLTSTSGGIFTRLRLGPITGCTHPSLNQIEWSFQIPANSIGIQLYPAQAAVQFNVAGARNDRFGSSTVAAGAAGGLLTLDEGLMNDYHAGIPTADHGGNEKLRFWIGYSNAAQIANQLDITYQGNNSGWTTGNFNYEQTILSSHSLSDSISRNSVTLTNIEELFSKSSPGSGTIIEIPLGTISAAAGYVYSIPTPITISGIIDLNQLNPIFNHFPIMTPGFSNVWIKLTMNNFLQCLQKVCLNKVNPTTGDYIPIQMTPPEKPDVVVLPFYVNNQAGASGWRNYLMRLVRIDGLNATTQHPETPIATMQGVYFTTFRTRQLTFQLEEQQQIEAMFRQKQVFYQPTKIFRSARFNQINRGVSVNQLQVQISMANIDKFYITFNYRNDYPIYLPTPTLTEINPMWRGATILPSADRSLDKPTAYKIFNAFVDVDCVAPPTELYDSVIFKNTDKNENTPAGVYGTQNLFTTNTSLFVRGLSTPTYCPNQFVYAIDASGGNFFRGYNAIGRDYDSTSLFQMQITDIQANGILNITVDANTQDQNSFANFINTTEWGSLYYSNGTSAVHCLCDSVLKFTFDQNGYVSGISTNDLI